jgi:hypothetical protein
MQEKLTQYIEVLAQKLGVAAEHLYGVLVRQAKVEGIIGLILYGVLIPALLFVSYKVVSMAIKKWDDIYEADLEMPTILGIIFLLAITVIITICGFMDIPGDIGRLINPEYYAIKELLDVIK